MMDPVIGAALISGASGLIGGMSRNKAAQRAAANQMAFQKEMSNTSYQRGMADMKKAGLNPILAGKMGGASTPGGATYQPENVGMAAQQSFANVANVMAQTAKTKEETRILKETNNSPIIKTTDVIGEKVNDGINKVKNSPTYKKGKKKLKTTTQKILDDLQSYAINKAIKKKGSKTTYKGKKVYPDRIMRTK